MIAPAKRTAAWLRVAINTLAFASLALVAGTSWPAGLTGDRLLWHVGSAPAFALAAVAIAILWAHRNRFSAADWVRLSSPRAWAVPLRKLFFWLALLLAIPTLLSVIAAMFPVFDTDGEQNLIALHRSCGPWLAAASALFACFALLAWRQGVED